LEYWRSGFINVNQISEGINNSFAKLSSSSSSSDFERLLSKKTLVLSKQFFLKSAVHRLIDHLDSQAYAQR